MSEATVYSVFGVKSNVSVKAAAGLWGKSEDAVIAFGMACYFLLLTHKRDDLAAALKAAGASVASGGSVSNYAKSGKYFDRIATLRDVAGDSTEIKAENRRVARMIKHAISYSNGDEQAAAGITDDLRDADLVAAFEKLDTMIRERDAADGPRTTTAPDPGKVTNSIKASAGKLKTPAQKIGAARTILESVLGDAKDNPFDSEDAAALASLIDLVTKIETEVRVKGDGTAEVKTA